MGTRIYDAIIDMSDVLILPVDISNYIDSRKFTLITSNFEIVDITRWTTRADALEFFDSITGTTYRMSKKIIGKESKVFSTIRYPAMPARRV